MLENKKGQMAQESFKARLESLNQKYYDASLNLGNTKKDFKTVRKIGQGSFGIVHRVICTATKKSYVLKVMGDPKKTSTKYYETLYKECHIHMQLDHPNIIKLYKVFFEDGMVYLVLEYADSGDLQTVIQRTKDGTRQKEAVWWRYAQQITNALHYMHNMRIAHRDIKGMNIFLNRTGQFMDCKLGDFGISKQLEVNVDFMKTIVGTPQYLSPEIVKKQLYTVQCDLWAMGVLLFSLLTGQAPFKGGSQLELGNNICNQELVMKGSCFTDKIRGVVAALLVKDYKNRIDIRQMSRLLNEKEYLDNFDFGPYMAKTGNHVEENIEDKSKNVIKKEEKKIIKIEKVEEIKLVKQFTVDVNKEKEKKLQKEEVQINDKFSPSPMMLQNKNSPKKIAISNQISKYLQQTKESPLPQQKKLQKKFKQPNLLTTLKQKQGKRRMFLNYGISPSIKKKYMSNLTKIIEEKESDLLKVEQIQSKDMKKDIKRLLTINLSAADQNKFKSIMESQNKQSTVKANKLNTILQKLDPQITDLEKNNKQLNYQKQLKQLISKNKVKFSLLQLSGIRKKSIQEEQENVVSKKLLQEKGLVYNKIKDEDQFNSELFEDQLNDYSMKKSNQSKQSIQDTLLSNQFSFQNNSKNDLEVYEIKSIQNIKSKSKSFVFKGFQDDTLKCNQVISLEKINSFEKMNQSDVVSLNYRNFMSKQKDNKDILLQKNKIQKVIQSNNKSMLSLNYFNPKNKQQKIKTEQNEISNNSNICILDQLNCRSQGKDEKIQSIEKKSIQQLIQSQQKYKPVHKLSKELGQFLNKRQSIDKKNCINSFDFKNNLDDYKIQTKTDNQQQIKIINNILNNSETQIKRDFNADKYQRSQKLKSNPNGFLLNV